MERNSKKKDSLSEERELIGQARTQIHDENGRLIRKTRRETKRRADGPSRVKKEWKEDRETRNKKEEYTTT